MEGLLVRPAEDGAPGRCRKHPVAQPRTGGVCPDCIRAHLLRLCPDCAGERPHGCSCPSTSSVAAASSSFPSSASPFVPDPIAVDPELQRSMSAAPRRPRARFDEEAEGGGDGAEPARVHGGGGGWSWLWPLARGKKAEKGMCPGGWLPRSKSVGANPRHDHGGCGSGRWKGWSRYWSTISLKSFRRTSKVVQARSPSAAATEENTQLHT